MRSSVHLSVNKRFLDGRTHQRYNKNGGPAEKTLSDTQAFFKVIAVFSHYLPVSSSIPITTPSRSYRSGVKRKPFPIFTIWLLMNIPLNFSKHNALNVMIIFVTILYSRRSSYFS